MAKWVHPNGDTITTDGSTYTVTQGGVSRTADVGRWTYSAEKHMVNDIKDGYYEGFQKVNENEIFLKTDVVMCGDCLVPFRDCAC